MWVSLSPIRPLFYHFPRWLTNILGASSWEPYKAPEAAFTFSKKEKNQPNILSYELNILSLKKYNNNTNVASGAS